MSEIKEVKTLDEAKVITIAGLLEKLNKLNGYDFEKIDADERLAGNDAIFLSFSKPYQVRVAARALGVNVNAIKNLPGKQYLQITNAVQNFLTRSSDAEIRLENFD